MLEGAENRVALVAGPGAERLLLQTLGQVILSLWKTEWAGNQEKGQEMWAWEKVREIWEGSGNLRRGWRNLGRVKKPGHGKGFRKSGIVTVLNLMVYYLFLFYDMVPEASKFDPKSLFLFFVNSFRNEVTPKP